MLIPNAAIMQYEITATSRVKNSGSSGNRVGFFIDSYSKRQKSASLSGSGIKVRAMLVR